MLRKITKYFWIDYYDSTSLLMLRRSQIAGVLHKEGIHIAIQTIYNHVHADTSGRLAKHMPHELKYTRRVRATRPTKATNIANRTSIHDRPKEADGTRFGDWEMDTIVDSYGHAIVTLTERSTTSF